MPETIISSQTPDPETYPMQRIPTVLLVIFGIAAFGIHLLIANNAPLRTQVSINAFPPFSNGVGFGAILCLFSAAAYLCLKRWVLGAALVAVSIPFLYFSYFGGAMNSRSLWGQIIFQERWQHL